jgi:gelsolin
MVDAAFLNAGQAVGVEVWRIEKLAPVKQDPSLCGKFYTGDSYIVLNTYESKG